MDISSLNSTINPGSRTTSAQSTKTLGKDDFLKLFVTQLRAQDPLNPMDGTGFTAQMAQFSSLEQLQNMNDQMGNLVAFQGSLQNTLTASLIGKRVVTTDGTSGIVQGVSFGPYGTSLTLDNGALINISDIMEIQQGGN